MGVSHLIFAPDSKNENEGLMVDIDDNHIFEIGLGRWTTGTPNFGFNSAIGGLTFAQFSEIVDKLVELREKCRKPVYSIVSVQGEPWCYTEESGTLGPADYNSFLQYATPAQKELWKDYWRLRG